VFFPLSLFAELRADAVMKRAAVVGRCLYLATLQYHFVLPATMPECPGCGVTFIGRAYGLHLDRTTNGHYLQVRQAVESRAFVSHSDSDDSDEFGSEIAGSFPTGGGSFTGDFFGTNYTEADFNYSSADPSDSEPEPDSDSENDPIAGDCQAAADARTGDYRWEPPRPEPSRAGVDNEMEDIRSDIPPPTREKRKIAEDRFHEKPIIVKFPSTRAGEAISDKRSVSAEEQYSATLGASDNIYAPFATKMDWDIARWAKLRGSGSTAFTDLLQIKGVSHFDSYLILSHIHTLPGS